MCEILTATCPLCAGPRAYEVTLEVRACGLRLCLRLCVAVWRDTVAAAVRLTCRILLCLCLCLCLRQVHMTGAGTVAVANKKIIDEYCKSLQVGPVACRLSPVACRLSMSSPCLLFPSMVTLDTNFVITTDSILTQPHPCLSPPRV